MRRLVLFFAFCGVLAVPAGVLAARTSPGDGTLVVQGAQAPNGVAAVKLTITGSVIGQVSGTGKIVIDSGVSGTDPQVTGAGTPDRVKGFPTAQKWGYAENFKFRAVDGTFTILIYGSQVNFVALGKGWAKVAGSPEIPKSDGRYSLNGSVWRSLPSDQTDKLYLLANG
jgi:hypothetical protein